MNTIPAITNKDIKNKSERLILAMQTAKTLEAEIKDFWAQVKEQMTDHDIKKIDGDWGVIQFVVMPGWVANDLPPRFYKKTLDTARLNAMRKLGDPIPRGAVYTPFIKFDKRIK